VGAGGSRMSYEDFYDAPYVDLDRDLIATLDGENYARFIGEWSPDEKGDAGWERFTVMLNGEEAGDYAPATWEDLRRILEAYGEDA
jgi:hypothetical protein